MSVEPQKFFIGLIDFFSVLLPGAIFTDAAKDAGWVSRLAMRWPRGNASRPTRSSFAVSSS